MCDSAGEKGRKGLCKKRNVVYETFCEVCGYVVDEKEEKEDKSTDNAKKRKGGDENGKEMKLKNKKERKEYKYKYIGEE